MPVGSIGGKKEHIHVFLWVRERVSVTETLWQSESRAKKKRRKKGKQQHSTAVFGIVQALGELLESGLGKSQCGSLGRPTRWPPDKHQQRGRAGTARCVGCVGVQTTHKDNTGYMALFIPGIKMCLGWFNLSFKYARSQLVLECISTSLLSGHLWLGLNSLLYMQINTYIISVKTGLL